MLGLLLESGSRKVSQVSSTRSSQSLGEETILCIYMKFTVVTDPWKVFQVEGATYVKAKSCETANRMVCSGKDLL